VGDWVLQTPTNPIVIHLAHTHRALRRTAGGAAIITKTLIIAKDFYTYAIIFFRQENILRDHGTEWLASTLAALLAELMRSM
jgi:hypothetical protein